MAIAMMQIELTLQERAQLVQVLPPQAPLPRCQHSPRLPARCYAASRTGCWGSCHTCTQHMRIRGAQPSIHLCCITQSYAGPPAAASTLPQHPACWLPLIAMLPAYQGNKACARDSLTDLWAADVLLHLSATRIMRRRFLPSSFGLMDLACGGKKMAQAAFTLRTKSDTGPFVLDACADSPAPLTYDTDGGTECDEGHRSCGTDVRCNAAVCGRGSCPARPLPFLPLGHQASYICDTCEHGLAVLEASSH